MKSKIPLLFVLLSLFYLLFSAFIGLFLGFQSMMPAFLKEIIPFNTLRPIHVSAAVGWIIFSVTGGIYYYLIDELKLKLYSEKLLGLHFILFALSTLAVLYSLISGQAGGREYLAFSPYIMIPILLSWIIFAINFIKSTYSQIRVYPVYIWMWTTGIIFMIYHLSESNFWIITSIREDFIKDFTIQWKSYGSFVGAWNLLIYGTAIFLMSKVKGDDSYAKSKIAFFFYFLGLANLMLGWAHHIYILPAEPWIRVLSYIASMTEWIIIIKMIKDWKKSLKIEDKTEYSLTYKYLLTTDKWLFANLFIALLISIPSLNQFTHGTHIIVAHSMGTTIGINTTILLASIFFILKREYGQDICTKYPVLKSAIWIFNISLVGFLLSLLLMGFHRSNWMYNQNSDMIFSEMFELSKIYIFPFIISGFGLFVSFAISTSIAIRMYWKKIFIPKSN